MNASTRRQSSAQIIINAIDKRALSIIVKLIKSEQEDNITFESPTKDCYRPPFENGVHKIIYLSLGETSSE